MITTSELGLALATIIANSPFEEQDAYWQQGAIDILNLLIKKSQEKDNATPHYSFN